MKIEAAESAYKEDSAQRASVKATKEAITCVMMKMKVSSLEFTEQEIKEGARLAGGIKVKMLDNGNVRFYND